MYEKRFHAVPPQLLTSSGTGLGTLTIADASLFRVKQKITLRGTTLPNLQLEVKAVEQDGFTISLGPVKTDIRQRTDISLYTTLLLSTIEAAEQERPVVPEEQIERLTYQEEPAVARRCLLVDNLGRPYRMDNPLPVELSNGSISIENVNANLSVQLTDKDNWPTAGDIHDAVRIGDGVDELAVNPDGSINVNASIGVSGAAYPHALNVTMPLASTEYSVSLPQDTKRFLLRMRNASKCYVSYAAGGTSTDYLTMNCGTVYIENDISLPAPLVVYFKSVKPTEVAEVVYWTST